MSNAEHYFENLLFQGRDKDDVNKDKLSEIERETIEMCASYVIYSLFYDRDDFNDFISKRRRMNE